MRTARIKPFAADADGTYYHLVNRVSGSPTDYPFGEIEKEKFISSLREQAAFFTIDVSARDGSTVEVRKARGDRRIVNKS